MTTVALILVFALTMSSSLWAKSHRFELYRMAMIDGIELQPGIYKLKLNGNDEAEILRDNKVVVKTKVNVEPLGTAHANSVGQKSSGLLTEIRLKKERVVFPQSASGN